MRTNAQSTHGLQTHPEIVEFNYREVTGSFVSYRKHCIYLFFVYTVLKGTGSELVPQEGISFQRNALPSVAFKQYFT